MSSRGGGWESGTPGSPLVARHAAGIANASRGESPLVGSAAVALQADQSREEPSRFVVRTTVEPTSIASAVRQAIRSIDKNQSVWHVQTFARLPKLVVSF